MILPVFSLYAVDLEGTTPVLVGLALGAYGLTQALFQIPFGMLSDRFGRKPVICLGLLIFALGSVVAANADSIIWVIIGRALQGSGAIAAAVMALTADLTREEHRTKAMAVIGLSIGLSFAVSLVLGPVFGSWIGVSGIFWLTAVLAFVSILVLMFVVPTPDKSIVHRDAESVLGYFVPVLQNGQLLRLDFGVFVLHMVLTASFVVLPFALRDFAGLAEHKHWSIYLPILLIGLIAMVPLVIIAEKYRHLKQVFLASIVFIALGQFGLSLFHTSLTGLFLTLLLFFVAFNVLEALLPSLIAKYAPADKKGTAMGVYSTAQFSGAFVGGVTGGLIYGYWGISAVFGCCALLTCCWALWAWTMQPPRYLSNFMLHVGQLNETEQVAIMRRLQRITGVAEVTMVAEEGAAYMKIDRQLVDMELLEGFSVTEPGFNGEHEDGQHADNVVSLSSRTAGHR